MEFQLLKDMVLILGMAIGVLYIFHKLRIPSVIGFLLTGVITGPHGLNLISDIHDVEVIAEVGVILLLFTIGIEFSLKSLLKIGKILLIGGSFQVLMTIGAITLVALYMGNQINESIFIGFLITLSSTAIVLKMIQDKGEIDAPHGRISLGILIYQDIIIVPLMLLTPVLAGNSDAIGSSYWEIILKFAAVALVVVFGTKYIVPFALHKIARTQSRELFLFSIIVIAFAVAFFTYSLGLSLALGAFIAGLLISESEYSQQALGDVTPFLDVFASFFFISVGMLLNLQFVFDNPITVLVFTTLILSIKTLIAGGAAFILGYPLRTSIIVGFTLSQVGEFSFILSRIGVTEGLISDSNYQIFLSVSVMSMAATPLAVWFATRFANKINNWPLPGYLKNGLIPRPESTIGEIKDHVVIIGYGLNGRNVAHAARYAKIPYAIIDINPDTVRKERGHGEIIHYGDAGQEEILSHANTEDAMTLVSTLPLLGDNKRIIRSARKLNPHIHIIIRTRFVSDMKELYELGADEVIPEEFETSVEIFTRVLIKYLVPHEEIEKLVAEIRSDGYQMFRSISTTDFPPESLSVKVPGVEIQSLHVCHNAPAIGKSVGELKLNKAEGLSLLAISRSGEINAKPNKNFVLEENDVLFFFGPFIKLKEIMNNFREKDAGDTEE
jgi:CPA2 family monovalent cation:H+ antiporter-2